MFSVCCLHHTLSVCLSQKEYLLETWQVWQEEEQLCVLDVEFSKSDRLNMFAKRGNFGNGSSLLTNSLKLFGRWNCELNPLEIYSMVIFKISAFLFLLYNPENSFILRKSGSRAWVCPISSPSYLSSPSSRSNPSNRSSSSSI